MKHMPLLLFLLTFLSFTSCEPDENFDFLEEETDERIPLVVLEGDPFFEIETPDGEIITTLGSGVLIAGDQILVASSADIYCDGLPPFWHP